MNAPSSRTRAALQLAVVFGLSGCAGSRDPWPDAPDQADLPPKIPSVFPTDQLNEAHVGKLGVKDGRGNPVLSSPSYFYWQAEPAWEPIRNERGVIVGRRSTNGPLVEVLHLSGKHGRTVFSGSAPDQCRWKTIEVSQDALDNSGTAFDERFAIGAEGNNAGVIDCAVAEAARESARD